MQIFPILNHSILKFCTSLSCCPFSANVIKLFSNSIEFRRDFFERRFCGFKMVWFAFFREYLKLLAFIPKSIFNGEYPHQCTSCCMFIFRIQLNMPYSVYKIYISKPFIRTMISAIVQYFSWNTSESKTLKKVKAHIL